MKVTIFGATGALGQECLARALTKGYDVTVLARSPQKLPPEIRGKIRVEQGDALKPSDVARAMPDGTDAVLFAIGIDKESPRNLCTRVTEHIFREMKARPRIRRFVWWGGGSTFVADDVITVGARFVRLFASVIMRKRHKDKEQQYRYLEKNTDIDWLGVRPLNMKKAPFSGKYQLGFKPFSGLSSISYADCADAMISMLEDDTWLRKAPIIQY